MEHHLDDIRTQKIGDERVAALVAGHVVSDVVVEGSEIEPLGHLLTVARAASAGQYRGGPSAGTTRSWRTPGPQPPAAPRPLRVEGLLTGGWRVMAGSEDLQHFATEEDANRGLAVIALWDDFYIIDSFTPAPTVGPAHITFNTLELGHAPRPSLTS